LKKIGNNIVNLIGGREIHPINPKVGGFHKVFAKAELEKFTDDLKWAVDASLETIRLTAGLNFPDFERDYEFVAMRHPDEYPFNEGRIVSSKGLDISMSEFLDYFEEQHVRHSTSLHARVKSRGEYFVGPLARYSLNYDKLPAVVQDAAKEAGLGSTCRNPFKGIVVRAVEMFYACLEALRLIKEYEKPESPAVEVLPRSGVGCWSTEAPRGLLFHRYVIDDNGIIRQARIIPPTAQNQKVMETDLLHFAGDRLHLKDNELTWQCEQAIRNYDPCISCSCHFLKLDIERE